MAAAYFKLCRAHKLPLLSFFSHLSEEEQLAKARQSVSAFLQQVKNKTVLEEAQKEINLWQQDQHPSIPSGGLTVSDMVLVYSLRKELYLRYLGRYTQEVATYSAIAIEMEELHRRLEQLAFEAFVNIQQASLKKEKELTESIINNSTDGIMAFDAEERIVLWNKSLEERYKRKKEEVLGKKFFDVYPGLKGTEEGNNLYRVLQGETIFVPEHKNPYRYGWYEAYLVPLHDKEGRTSGAVSIVHDITQWKETQLKLQEQEAALKKSRDYYLTILEDFPSLIWRSNTEGLCDYFNKTWLRFRGRTMEQEWGNGWAEGVHADDFDRCLQIYRTNFEARKAFVMEYRMLRSDGTYRWIADYGSPMYDVDGCFSGFLGACFDIQERKDFEQNIQCKNAELQQAQQQLLQVNDTLELRVQERTAQLEVNEKQLRLLTNALPSCISYVDKKGIYRFVNDTYCLWFGLPKEQIENRHISEVVGEKAYAHMQPHIQEVLRGKEVRTEGEMDYLFGGSRTVITNLVPHLEQGRVLGFYGLVYDITEIRKAQESLEIALADITLKNKQLSKINNDLDSFVYTASHDLRNPVINLEGLLFALKKRLAALESEEVNRLIDLMLTSVSKLNQTILDLTEITKAQKGLEEAEEQISVQKKLKDIRAELAEIIRQADPLIQEDLQVVALTYARRNLRSILYNLLTNAIKYRSPERRLEINIKTYQEGDWIVLSVQDNGLGLDEQQRQKLFTMFKRLHTHVEGTGIGLYIIKRLVENGGGRIEVSSEPNVGSTFKVYLKQQPALVKASAVALP